MKILIVEDMEERHQIFIKYFKEHDITIATNADSAMAFLKNGDYDTLFLDHDLGGEWVFMDSNEHNTGCTIANFIVDNNIKIPSIIIHSQNPPGAQNIKCILPEAKIIPFNNLINIFKDLEK